MKAIVCTRYGPPDVLQLREIERPSPKDNEVLIRLQATTVTAGDCGLRSLKFPLLYRLVVRVGFGFRAPRNKILGQELAGEIEAVGNAVGLFKRGALMLSTHACLKTGCCRSSRRIWAMMKPPVFQWGVLKPGVC